MVQTKSKAKAPKNPSIAHGTGRRKSSVARAWFRRGRGAVSINEQDIKSYFDTAFDIETASTPMKVIPVSSNYDVQVTVAGGGKVSQAGAVSLAISRALLAMDENFRRELRKHHLLTVDDRVKERKKPGRKAARRSFQFVKR